MRWCILFLWMLLQEHPEPVSSQSRRIVIPADGNFKLKKLNGNSQTEDVDEDFKRQEFLTAVRKSMFEPLVDRYKDMETRRIMPGWMAHWPPPAYKRDRKISTSLGNHYRY
ncbi:hypothetical protein O0L34_g10406 [Tuta absoluta]|nr:hypothetical protein O0L34_g10406 [Tuta absoluta]